MMARFRMWLFVRALLAAVFAVLCQAGDNDAGTCDSSSITNARETVSSGLLQVASLSKPRQVLEHHIPSVHGVPLPEEFPKFDIPLSMYQQWLDAHLPQIWPQWLAKRMDALDLILTDKQVHSNGTRASEWILENIPCSETCDDKCARYGTSCDVEMMSSLTSEAAIQKAATLAGLSCGRFANYSVAPGWDGPWLSHGTCGYAVNKGGVDCKTMPPCDNVKFCACTGQFKGEVPSKTAERMHRYHSQWDNSCPSVDGSFSKVRPGPIAHHFHFVILGPRSKMVNKSIPLDLISDTSSEYAMLNQEDRLLVDNMRYTLALNNATSVNFLDDTACKEATIKISKLYNQLYEQEGDIRYKSDMCRLAAVYLQGGIYNDDDQVNYLPIVSWLKTTTNFASVKTDYDETYMMCSFMAATPCHPVIGLAMKWVIKARTGDEDILKPDGLLGPRVNRLAFDEAEKTNPDWLANAQLLLEGFFNERFATPPDRYGHHCDMGYYDPEDNNTLHACSRV